MPESDTKGIFARQAVWMFLARSLRLLAVLFAGVWVSRYLGPEGFGRFSYALSFVALFSAIAHLGSDDILVREFIVRPEGVGTRTILGSSIILRGCSGLTMAIVALVSGAVVAGPHVMPLIIVFVLAGFAESLARVFEKYLEAHGLGRFLACGQAVAGFLSVSATCWAITQGAGIWFLAVTRGAESVALLILLAIVSLRALGGISFRVDTRFIGRVLRQSWPLAVTSVFVLLYMRIDQVMLRHYMGEASVGHYSAAVRLVEVCFFVPMVLANALFPAVLAVREDQGGLYRLRTQVLHDAMLWLGLAVAIGMTLLARPMIVLVFGKEYRAAAPVLRYYAWCAPLVFVGIVRGKWLVSEQLNRWQLLFGGGAAFVNVALNCLLIPRLGMQGAALATLSAQFTTVVVAPLAFSAVRPAALYAVRSASLIASGRRLLRFFLAHVADGRRASTEQGSSSCND